ncbi:MAG TPA: NAD(+) diphosphatase [Propionicimonas sp.]|uniref:NAD(+) diphosphatase n=1 Tax=Propionicimonas sp. TaxID=1955623 RepID=UPI002F429CE2
MIDWRNGSDLDRVAELRIDPEWVLAAWSDPDAVLLRVGEASVEAGADGSLLTRRVEAAFDPEVHYLLGRIDGRPWFATRVRAEEELTALRTVMDGLPAVGLQAAFTAVGLTTWHDVSRFCPRCGSATRAVHGGQSRKCTACGLELYPRTDPAVIVAIVDPDNRLLLGRQPVWAPGRYSVFAGFVEVGESLEQTVHREMAEEVGLALTGVTYLGSQPWPFPRSLMVGFLAHTTRDEPVPAVGEIELARWFTHDELVVAMATGEVILPPHTSIARRMIESWLDGSLGS